MTDNFNAFATLSSIKQVYLRLHDAHLLFHTAAQRIMKRADVLAKQLTAVATAALRGFEPSNDIIGPLIPLSPGRFERPRACAAVPEKGHEKTIKKAANRTLCGDLLRYISSEINAWRTGSSYGLWLYRTSYVPQHASRGSGSLRLSKRRARRDRKAGGLWKCRASQHRPDPKDHRL